VGYSLLQHKVYICV